MTMAVAMGDGAGGEADTRAQRWATQRWGVATAQTRAVAMHMHRWWQRHRHEGRWRWGGAPTHNGGGDADKCQRGRRDRGMAPGRHGDEGRWRRRHEGAVTGDPE